MIAFNKSVLASKEQTYMLRPDLLHSKPEGLWRRGPHTPREGPAAPAVGWVALKSARRNYSPFSTHGVFVGTTRVLTLPEPTLIRCASYITPMISTGKVPGFWLSLREWFSGDYHLANCGTQSLLDLWLHNLVFELLRIVTRSSFCLWKKVLGYYYNVETPPQTPACRAPFTACRWI